MTADMGMKYSEMVRAAHTVGDTLPAINDCMNTLSQAISAHALGFSGLAARAFGEAVDAWFDAAAGLNPLLDSYARALVETANDAIAADTVVSDNYSAMLARLSGGS